MRKVLFGLVLTGLFFSAFSTDVRVLTMGRHDNFFMDDYSIFRNPANISVYPNMMLGSIGYYTEDTLLDPTESTGALDMNNRDPQMPYFGGILSYSLNQSADAGDQYPMISLGAVFNRQDKWLNYIDPRHKSYWGVTAPKGKTAIFSTTYENGSLKYSDPVGKVDVLLAMALKNGVMIGVGGYVALQDSVAQDDSFDDIYNQMRLVKCNLGVNIPFTKTVDFEFSASGGSFTHIVSAAYIGEDNRIDTLNSVVALNDVGLQFDARLFMALSSLNGDFVPHASFSRFTFAEDRGLNYSFDLGFAVNVNVDRGFFWTGIEGYFSQATNPIEFLDKEFRTIGGKVCFGIERNILWDWFVIRAGGNKTLSYNTRKGKNSKEVNFWDENEPADASDDDLLSIGIGVNIENRFKIDLVMAEDILYTFTNLLSGNHHHLFTRISATFSF